MDRYILVNADKAGENGVAIVDTETRKFQLVTLDANVLKYVPAFRSISKNYEGDIVSIENSEGTIMYADKYRKYYGVLKYNERGLQLYWIADIDLTLDIKKRLLNTSCRHAIILDKFDEKMTLNTWMPKVNVSIVKSLKRSFRAKNLFIDYIEGRIPDFDTEIRSESKEITSQTESNTTAQTEAKDTELIVKPPKQIEKVPVAINYDAEEMKRLERLDNLLSKVDSLLSRLEGQDYEDAVATIVNVNDIYRFDDYHDDEIKQTDLIYETLLKMASPFDSISITREYYEKIIVRLQKPLTSSLDYSSYKSIAIIRFESGSQFGILCIIDYTEGNEMVRITILKRYDNKPITSDEINRYYIHYEQLRKKSMYMLK